jgi:hypothetical protein
MSTHQITEDALREAYSRTQLAGLGISFDRALTIIGIRNSLTGMVRAERMWAQNTLLQGSRYLDHQTKEHGQ